MYLVLYYKDEELKTFYASYKKPNISKHWVQLDNGNWQDTRNPTLEFVEFIAVDTHNKAKFFKEYLGVCFRDNGYEKLVVKNSW